MENKRKLFLDDIGPNKKGIHAFRNFFSDEDPIGTPDIGYLEPLINNQDKEIQKGKFIICVNYHFIVFHLIYIIYTNQRT